MKAFQSFGHAALIVFAVVFGLASNGFAQKIITDYDHHVDFSQYKTYSWERVKTDDPLWQSRITDAVDKELQAKGWQKVESGGDVRVAAVAAVRNRRQYETFYNGWGPGWRWGGFGDRVVTVEHYRVGTLVIDMFDGGNHQLIWRGVAQDTLSDKPEKNEHKLEKAGEKMFKDFPPKRKE